MTFRIEQPRELSAAPHCGSDEVWDQGGVERTFRTVPIGRKPVVLQLQGAAGPAASPAAQARQVKLAFADPRSATPGPSSATPWSCRGT